MEINLPDQLGRCSRSFAGAVRAGHFSERRAQRETALTRFCTSERVKSGERKWDFCLLSA